jgi:hypothetical protein
MPLRASFEQTKADAEASLTRLETVIAQIQRSLDDIERRLIKLRMLRKASAIRARKPRLHA